METVKGERFSDIRVAQAVEVGAEVLVTACPYCIANFEDSRLALKDERYPGDQGYHGNYQEAIYDCIVRATGHSRPKKMTRRQTVQNEVLPQEVIQDHFRKPWRAILATSWWSAAVSAAFRPRLIWPLPVSRSTWLRNPRAIGGHMAQLDKTYPTNDCSM
jgi:hypothetical protein